MGTNQRYSQDFKEAMVKKLLNRGNQTLAQFCSSNNLKLSTLTYWQGKCANVGDMMHKKDKSKYSSEKILKIISETYSYIVVVPHISKLKIV